MKIMYLLIVFLPLLGSFVAGFFGRFLGSERIAIMTTTHNIVLFSIFMIGLIFLFRLLCFRKKKGFLLKLLYISLLFFISVFCYFLRIYLLSRLSLHFTDLFSFLVVCSVVSGAGQSLPLPPTASSPVPSISIGGDSWIEECFGTQPEESSSAPAQGQRQQEEGCLFQPTQPSTARAPEPSTSSTWSGSWIRDWLYPEVSSSAPNQGGQPQEEGCLFQPTQPSPADSRQEPTPPHSTEPEAAPPSQSVSPYPYAFDLIGGESVEGIKRRLLLRHEGDFTFEVCELARIQAEDLFEAKVEILREMSRLDPEGPWLERGARALDNPRTSTGEESLERLFSILDQLKEGGRESDAFIRLKKKL